MEAHREMIIAELGDGSGGPEFEKLVERLKGCSNFRLSRGDQWNDYTPEDRAAGINKGLDQSNAVRHSFAPSRKRRVNVRDYLDSLKENKEL